MRIKSHFSVLRAATVNSPKASTWYKQRRSFVCPVVRPADHEVRTARPHESKTFELPASLKEKTGTYHNFRRATAAAEFTRNLAKSRFNGLACHADAMLATRKALQAGLGAQVIYEGRLRHCNYQRGNWAERKFTIRCSIHSEDDPSSGLFLTLPRVKKTRCRILGARDRTIIISHSSTRLSVHMDAEAPPSGRLRDTVIGTIEEICYLGNMNYMVIDRFCTELTFQSYEEAASTIAEGLLRVLQFKTSILHIDRLQFKVEFKETIYEPSTSFSVDACWEPAGQTPIGHEDDSREVEVTVNRVAEEKEGIEQSNEHEDDECDGHDSNGINDQSNKASPKANLSSVSLAHTVATETISSHLRPSSSGSSHIRLQLPIPSSSSITEKVGTPLESFFMQWNYRDAMPLHNVPRSELNQIVESCIVNAAGGGLFAALQGARLISQNLIGNPRIALAFRQYGLPGENGQQDPQGGPLVTFCARFNAAKTISEITRLGFLGSQWHQSHVGRHLRQQPDYLQPDYRFTDIRVNEQDGNKQDAASFVPRLRDLIEAHILPTVEKQSAKSLNELAHQSADAIMQMPQPLAGILYFSDVKVSLRAVTNGHVDKRGSATAQRGKVGARERDGIFVALGSNLGDRVRVVENACRNIEASGDIRVVATSSLFETEPMYVEDQNRFLNGVCKIDTALEPTQLLNRLQAIENDLGRVKTVDKGPRNIDLDIVAYNNTVMDTERLVIPHRLMLEREFVLRPISDIGGTFQHPVTGHSMNSHLHQLQSSHVSMYPLTPLAPGCHDLRSLDPARRTMIMSILNVTPDSFSDGGFNQPGNIEELKATVTSHIARGATIIDIGGQSSRPHAPDVTADEELARILPAIEAIKCLPEASKVAISIDTYRASVAEAAVKAGAHIINDISAGLLDPEMLPTVARLGCTYIMMHMRGTPHTMQNEENTSYPNGVINTVARELKERLSAAQEAGIRRWRIILDPGVGFAKTTEQNLEILRHFSKLRRAPGLETLPWLVGSSRKGFIGKITGVEEASERVAGTAATVTAAVQGGAEIVRVHDVEEMAKVVKMADAMYRMGTKV